MTGIDRAVVEDGVAVWHARTVPELADAVRWLAGKLSEVEAPEPPDLSGYVPLEDFEALQAQVTTLAGQVTALEASTSAMQTQVTQIDTDLDTVSADLDALDARVVVLETPPAP